MKTLLNSVAALLAIAFTTTAAEQGFKPLFNGKDLTHWKGNPELWSVKDGAITGTTQADPANPAKSTLKHNTFLVYEGGQVKNFELRFQYRIVAGNSGVQYRSRVLEQGEMGPIVTGYQADFEAGTKHSGILYEEKGRGILAMRGQKTVIKPAAAQPANSKKKAPAAKVEVTGEVGNSDAIQAKIKSEDWNDYVIIADGNHLQHFINGQQTIDVTDEDADKAAKSGLLALQIHQGPAMVVQFRDIRIKTLGGR